MTRKTRKDVELEISSERAEELYSDLLKWSGNEFAGFMFEGSLLDEYAVVMVDNLDWKINLTKGRPILARKYVYIKEEYINEWSSKNILVLTDSKKEFEEFCKSRFINKQNFEDYAIDSGLND